MKKITLLCYFLLSAVICFAGVAQDNGIKGGIVVHLNCENGEKTLEMASGNDCLVHGLDTDLGNISRARKYIQSMNLYERVTVSHYDGVTLPYRNNLINQIVVGSLGNVPMSEIMRVLVPNGTALIGGKKVVKPWPKDIDTWPQYLNKADNNAVAMDSVVGPPRRMQWVDTPTWSRSHMGISTIVSMVTCNGRMFSIEDRALPDNPFLPAKFMFIARDAFNGRTLWTRKIERWESVTVYIKSLPTQQQRRMVATDHVLYCTPTLEGPLAALDAATGKTLKTYEDISPVQEVAYDQGILFVNVGERFNAGAYIATAKKAPKGAVGTPGEEFSGSGFKKGYAPQIIDKETPISTIVAIDPKSGKQLWKTKALKSYTGASLAIKGAHAIYQTSEGMFCVNAKTGKELWSVKKQISNELSHDAKSPGTMPNTVIITDDKVFAVEGAKSKSGGLSAYSIKSGKLLWNVPVISNYGSSADVFYVKGVVWLGTKGGVIGLDAETGKMVKEVKQKVTGPMGHDRCYRNMISEKFFINSKTGGADFIDLENGNEYPNHWTRGTCGTGVLPANGLLYSTPYSCTCSLGDMMKGMNAFSADPELFKSNDSGLIKRIVQLEKGPAYEKISKQPTASDDWPTYRGNNFRGGITKSAVSGKLKVKWSVKLPANPTASTVAEGKVYVCTPETHMVYALDSSTGKTAWTFTADGRINAPPTYYNGMLLFGSNDGWIYCLRASDGALSWRFKDLPDRLVGAFGKLASAWPVPSSILVVDDKLYAAAGRSSYLDGGMFLYCLDPTTGELLNSRSIYGPFAKDTGNPVGFKSTGSSGKGSGKIKKAKANNKPVYVPGFSNDVLTSNGKELYIRHAAFNKELEDIAAASKHLMPLSGFLDRRVQHRTGFILSDHFEWWKNNPKDIMISDGEETYGVAGFQSSNNHAYFDPRTGSYTLTGKNVELKLPINGRALSKGGDVIFVAGEQMKFKEFTWKTYVDAYDGKLGGKLMAISAKDGKEIATYELEASPVWDSIALAKGKLYISLEDGTIQCMGE